MTNDYRPDQVPASSRFGSRVRPLDVLIAISIVAVLVFAVAWSPTSAGTGPSGLVTQTPVRVFNTRSGPQPAAGSVFVVDTGHPGASAAVANITSIGATTPGQYLTAWASGPQPDTSVLNTGVGDVIANSIIVPLAPDGTFLLYTFASAHLLVDISGYFDGGSALPPSGLTATITGYVQVPSLGETRVIGTAGNGTSDSSRLVRVEIICPGGELETDQLIFGAFETKGFEVYCNGVHAGGATIRGLVDL